MVRSHLVRLFALLLVALPAWAGAEREIPPMEKLVRPELLLDRSAVAGGERIRWGVRLQTMQGWHTYWQNPGDSGLPTRIEWTLPEGFAASPIRWPVPDRFLMGSVVNFGYGEEVVLLGTIEAPGSLPPGEVEIRAKVDWLVCEEVCLPGGTTLARKLPTGRSEVDAAASARLDAAERTLPIEAPWKAELRTGDDAVVLLLPELGDAPVASAFFFPAEGEVIEHGAEQRLVRTEGGLELRMVPSAYAEGLPSRLEGVLLLEEPAAGGGTTKRGFAIRAAAPSIQPAAAGSTKGGTPTGAPSHAPTGSAEGSLGVAAALGLALLGGLVLNLMPCVFPVLSLKVLGVVQQASETASRVRLHGLAYTAGILVSFALLSGLLLVLRAGGAEIGWGFQLQSPGFVAVLAYLLFALGLSLSGVFHIGGSFMGIGHSLASRPGLSGSFFTGVLATVVATPCTAPFMGAAVGFALLQPAPVAVGIFLSLGLGLALPFLILSFVPALHRLLPRPGAWMVRFQQALAFPLYGTVAWLVWVLQRQVGPEALAAVLAGLVLVAFAAWAWAASRESRGAMRRVGSALGIGAAAAALLLARLPAGAERSAAAPAVSAADSIAEPWSEERLEQLRAEGKPVFVNFTAAWCVTCLVNERTTLGTERVRSLFAEKGITYLKGDWTNEDPAITAALERHGRSGVPLYLYYPAGGGEPKVLPQILTEEIVRDALADR